MPNALATGASSGIVWQSAERVAEVALRAVERGDKLCVPGAFNKVGAGALHMVPRAIAARLAGAFGAPT